MMIKAIARVLARQQVEARPQTLLEMTLDTSQGPLAVRRAHWVKENMEPFLDANKFDFSPGNNGADGITFSKRSINHNEAETAAMWIQKHFPQFKFTRQKNLPIHIALFTSNTARITQEDTTRIVITHYIRGVATIRFQF
jgi:hypothetical protein